MSAFITTSDYDASIHTEILDAITRSDVSAVELAEDYAIEEMRGYMSSRYDCDAIFSQTGESRNKIVLLMAIDITLYHLHSAHNPRSFPAIRKDRYERAVDWLKMVQKGQVNPTGLPKVTDSDSNKGNATNIIVSSNPKRSYDF